MVESPCNKVCINNEDNICVGCGRTLDEIASWTSFTEEEKIECVKKSYSRLEILRDALS